MSWTPGCKWAAVVLVPLLLVGCYKAPPPTPFPDLPIVSLARTKVITNIDNGAGHWVPKLALLLRAGIPGVFVVREGRARFQMVKPGQSRDKYVQVLSGLSGAETILTGDLQHVHDGSPLAPAKQSEQ